MRGVSSWYICPEASFSSWKILIIFWENQGNIREFYFENCVGTLLYHENDTITITVTHLKNVSGIFTSNKIHNFDLVHFLYFQNMSYLVLVIVVCMVSECHCASNGTNFIQGPADVYLNCILLGVALWSIIDCASSSSDMEHYETRFAYRNGKCHVCRADNENCVTLDYEYQLADPHFAIGENITFVLGRSLFILKTLSW